MRFRGFLRVDDGARTHDTRNHNPMLYQLNYIHHVRIAKVRKKSVLAIPESIFLLIERSV